MLLALFANAKSEAQVTVGSGGTYPTLAEAFMAINDGNIQGDIILQIVSSISEGSTAVLYPDNYLGTSDYSSVTVYPTGSGYTISGDIDGPLIDLNGATNVIINGAVHQSGNADLIISNMNTGNSASTIRFTESASNNTVKYCILKGSGLSSSGGIVFFSTTTPSVTVSGNDGNRIEYNNITAEGSNRPVNAIYSLGESGFDNSENIISNNNIFNFLNHGLSSCGILISSYSTNWTISGNSFYETTNFIPTGALSPAFYAIQINNISGTGFIISGNFIGGSSANCGGTWTKTNARNNIFYGIYLNAGTGSISGIQNNTIKNFSWSNSGSAAWTAMHVAGGDVNIGTTTGNTIGSATGTGSLIITGGASNTNVYGINIATSGTAVCRNNIIGAITTVNGASNSANIFGINKTSSAGTTTISNNTIGSESQSNSINASSLSNTGAQSVCGISSSGSGTVTISGNNIGNLTNGTTNSNTATSGVVNGIRLSDGTCSISDNTIHDLTIANANISASNTASVSGIALSGSTLKTVTGNTIYTLKNTYSSFAGSLTGIYFSGSTGANSVSNNFVYGLSVTGASSLSASLYGIKAGTGAAAYSNNIINIGGNTQTNIYGIYETGTAGENNNLYFNTVYLSGTPTAGTNNSYALFSTAAGNNRDFRNNILQNARSNSGATGKHYSVYIASSAGSLVIDNNNYFTNGTGGVFGYLASADITNLTDWKTATTQDAGSLDLNPAFSVPGGTIPGNYLPATSLPGDNSTGITTDYNGALRNNPPTMGALEGGSCSNPADGGSIAVSQNGCTPFDPEPFTSLSPATGYTGSSLEYKWQKSTVNGSSGFSDIPGSNSATYDAGSLTQTTWFRRLARISCIIPDDWSGAAVSNAIEVTVNALPVADVITGSTQVCIGSTLTLTPDATGAAPLSYTWASSDNSIATVNNSGVVTPIAAGGAGITYTVTDVNSCNASSAPFGITVNPSPAANLTIGGPGFICTGSSASVTVELSQSGVNYQLRNDNANELVGTPLGGTGGTLNLPTDIMTYNITYNIYATNTLTTCSTQLTEKETVNTDPLSVGGSISGTASVTYGSASGTMTLSGQTGVVQRWEKRFNSGSWTNISNTASTYSETPSGAGTWDYRAVVKSGNCAEANSSPLTLTVNKADLLITADNKSKDYGAALPLLTVTYTGLVNGDVATATPPAINTTATASSPATTYPITASGAADPNYNISYSPGTLTINKVSLQIRADDKTKVYGAVLPSLSVTYTGLVNGDTAPVTPPSISTTATAASPVGTYPITASGAIDPNYNISYTAGTMTIDKVSLIITPDNKTKDYGASLPVLTVSYTGLVNGDVAPVTLPSISTTATAASPVGTYPVTASGAADPNYNISYVAGNLTIDKVGLIITPDNKNKNYGAALPVLTAGYTGFVNGDTAPSTLPSIVTAATSSSPVGTYSITASGAADPNYNITYAAGTLTVDKVPLTITADDKTKILGDPLPALTVSYTGLVNADIAPATRAILSTTASQSSPLGTYPITATGAADPNYNISYVSGTLSIVNALLTITVENKSKIYGDGIPVLTVSYSGLIDGDLAPSTPPTISTTATSSSPTGVYPVTATGASDPKYFMIYVQGSLTVSKAPLNITADDKTKYYGEDLPVLTLSYTGLVNGDTETSSPPVLSTTATTSSPAGSYPITASGASDTNYDITYTEGTINVEKAVLQVAADNKTRVYNTPNPGLTFTISGFVNSETQSVLDVLPLISTTAIQSSPVDSYPITLSGGNDNNYSFVYVSGQMTITQAAQIITFTGRPEKLLLKDAYPLVATSTSGLTVLFESLNPELATVSGNTLTAVADGNALIKAYHPGDQNYFPAEVTATVEIYSTHMNILYLFTPNNDAINDYWELPDLSTWGKSNVKVYSRWGQLVFSEKDYQNRWDGTSKGSPLPEGPYYFIIDTENAGVIKGTVNIVR